MDTWWLTHSGQGHIDVSMPLSDDSETSILILAARWVVSKISQPHTHPAPISELCEAGWFYFVLYFEL